MQEEQQWFHLQVADAGMGKSWYYQQTQSGIFKRDIKESVRSECPREQLIITKPVHQR